jgi:tetratricopeptide (TPR) repeat protein
LAATHIDVGNLLQTLGRFDEAGEHLRADLEIRRALVAASPEDSEARDFLGSSHGQLGIHLFLLGQWPAASEHFEAQREIFTELVAHDPANATWRYKRTWSDLEIGRVAWARGEPERAQEAWETARRSIEDLLELDATPHKWRRTRAVVLYHLALLGKLRADTGARDTVLAALKILEELTQARPTDRAVGRWLSQSYLLLGSLEEAPASVRAFERAEEVVAPFARGTRDATVLAPWAAALSCLDRHDEVRSVAATLETLRYSEPGLVGLCPTRTGAAMPTNLER